MPRPALPSTLWLFRALAIGLALAPMGCLRHTANRILEAPNRQANTTRLSSSLEAQLRSRSFEIPCGSPAVPIRIAVLEPGDYALKYAVHVTFGPDGHGEAKASLEYQLTDQPPHRQPAKGTLLLLHGMRLGKESMLPWGLCLAEAGYRVVLMDLRGHGQSGGRWLGFGAFEIEDLRTVLDHLQKRGLFEDRVGILGVSYGGTLGIQLAGQDARVAALVALAPYSEARRGMFEFLKGYAPNQARSWTEFEFREALEASAKRAGFRWDDRAVLEAMARVTAPSLLIHGKQDTWIPPSHSLALAAQNRAVTLRLSEGDNHVSLGLRLAPFDQEVKAFFQRHLATPPPP